ncbi:MFS transporter [Planosporangium thailandense]|uniref:MFS transporter n=1 Tax=Planosporangium thailandense TaxID=765197 RepID=A0ABX0XXR0_9ACTN|nr:MFS transporter [Planosporangium thailandense]NJC70702.1 MFS transporter [Planosporangium thailandense]
MHQTVVTSTGAGRAAVRPVAAFLLLAAVQFVLIAAITVLSVALPGIQREFGLSAGDLAFVSAAYGLSFSGLLMLGGRLTDLLGRRRVFIIGVALFTTASVAAALASGYAVLLAARFGQGVGAALAAPAAMALLGVVFPDPVTHRRMTAVWGTVASIGATAGTLLSGVVLTWASWRWTMVLPAAVGLMAWVGGTRLLPAGPTPVRAEVDYLGATLITAGLSAVSYALVAGADHGLASPAVFVPLMAGVLLLAVFLLVEAKAAAPLVPLAFLASARRGAALLAVLLAAGAMSGVFFFLALYFQQIRGLSPLATSGAFVPFSAALLVTGALAGRLIAGVGARTATVAGLALAAVGLVLLGRLDAGGTHSGFLLVGLVVFPVGAGLTFSGATVAAVEGAPADRAGLAAGAVNTAMEIGPTVGLALLVSVAGTATAQLPTVDMPAAVARGYGFAFTVAAAPLALCACYAALALRPRNRQPKESS